jgi:hypothetical protein
MVVAMLLAFVLTACGQAPPPQNGVAYRLYTHCGVLYTKFEGEWYYADPPVSDGSGNPTRGWNNPYDDGTMTRIDAGTILFTDPAGNRARFTTHPAYAIPTILPCD